MTTRVISTPYGRPALDALQSVVSAQKRPDKMAPVTVIVPNNLAGIVARRHLAHGLEDGLGAVAGLYLTTLPRLAEQLVAHHLHPRRPAAGPVVAAAWRRQLTRDAGRLEAVKDHPATVRALASANRELRDLSDGARDSVRKVSGLADDLVRLHEAVSSDLSRGWYDVTDLLHSAADLVRSNASSLAPHGLVVLYLPQAMTRAETTFARTVAEQADVVTVVGMTGVARADRRVLRRLEELGLPAPKSEVRQPLATTVLHASDSDDEVRFVARRVVAALADDPAHRVAVLYGSATPYARLLHEQLNAVGVRVNGPSTRAVHERAVARGFLGTLELGLADMPRGATFGVLAEAPVSDLRGGRVRVATWERVSRAAGVVAGADWEHRLGHHADDLRTRLERARADADPVPSRVEAIERELGLAEELLAFARALRARLGEGLALRGWPDLATWAVALFEDLYGFTDDLRSMPPDEQYATVVIQRVLQGLAGLDADAEADLFLLIEVLGLELESALPRVGRFGEGVYVGPLSSAVGLDLDDVFVVGLAEDAYPGRPRQDALLSDRVRAATEGELRTPQDRVDDQHRHFLTALQSGGRSTVSFARGDLRRSTQRLPSRFLLPTLRHVTGDPGLAATKWDKHGDVDGRLAGSSSFADSLTGQEPATEQEWQVRARLTEDGWTDPAVEAAEQLLAARSSDDFTRFDGNLSDVKGLPAYASAETVVSPTMLETYATCPHRFLLQRLLRVEPLEVPEEVIQVSALEIGNLVHEVMEELVKDSVRLPSYGEPWSTEDRQRLVAVAVRKAEAYVARGVTGHPRLWRHELSRVITDLERMLDGDDQWRAQRDAEVVASELDFGMGGKPPVRVEVPGGAILLRGSADKVDRTRDGVLLVTDIKTGSARKFKGLDEDPVAAGTKLQLPVYALAALQSTDEVLAGATRAEAQYWFVRAADRGKRIPVVLDDETQRLYASTLGGLVASIATGLFPAKPSEKAAYGWVDCPWCTPDGVGHEEARESYERKRRDPALSALVGLIDPQEGTS